MHPCVAESDYPQLRLGRPEMLLSHNAGDTHFPGPDRQVFSVSPSLPEGVVFPTSRAPKGGEFSAPSVVSSHPLQPPELQTWQGMVAGSTLYPWAYLILQYFCFLVSKMQVFISKGDEDVSQNKIQ